MKLSGNTVVLTGGGSGIGLALAAELLRRGNQVIITGRDAAKLEEAARAHPGLVARRCDVTREEDRQALADWPAAAHPGFKVWAPRWSAGTQQATRQGVGGFDTQPDEVGAPCEFVRGMRRPALHRPGGGG
ncbi:MAG: SDR family NAD(P)-dependent oxidoreductase [Myxococcota bacterium]|nr:SDR family NAD(P)-dependent oxidoreductase [Myxococcota bacterium]